MSYAQQPQQPGYYGPPPQGGQYAQYPPPQQQVCFLPLVYLSLDE